MSRAFKAREFSKSIKKLGISDTALRSAVLDAEAGMIAAHLGGELIKIRVARQGFGKSSGYRLILAFRKGERSFYLHCFAKNEKDNLSADELTVYKEIAGYLLNLTETQLETLKENGALIEL